MKKIILGLIVSLFIISSVGAGFAFAETETEPYDGCTITNTARLPVSLNCTASCPYDTGNCGMCCLLNSIYVVTDWVFVILIAISTLMIIYGAVLFTTSSGDPEKTGKARQLILFAAVGLAVAFFAKGVPAIVRIILAVQ